MVFSVLTSIFVEEEDWGTGQEGPWNLARKDLGAWQGGTCGPGQEGPGKEGSRDEGIGGGKGGGKWRRTDGRRFPWMRFDISSSTVVFFVTSSQLSGLSAL